MKETLLTKLQDQINLIELSAQDLQRLYFSKHKIPDGESVDYLHANLRKYVLELLDMLDNEPIESLLK